MESCLYHIKHIGASLGLGQNIAHAGHFKHCTYTAASDNARTRRCRLEHNAGTSNFAQNFVRNSCTNKVYDFHILTSTLGGLSHCIGHCICLADTHRNSAFLVADHHSDTELKATSTFHYFCNTSNLNDALLELVLRFEILLFSFFVFCHFFLHSNLELQAAFTSAVCKSFHTSTITVTAAIKNNGFDPFAFCTFSDLLTNQL